MGTSLSGLTPATTFDGLLKVGDNQPLDGTLKAISTGEGTDTILQLSDSALSIGGNVEIDSSGLNSFIVKRNGTELLKTDGSGLNGALIFTGNLTNKFSLGVKGNDFNIWDGSYLGGGDLRFSILADGKTAIGAQTPTAKLHIKGSGATSATTSLLVQNSNGADVLQTLDNGSVGVGGPANASYRVSLPSGTTRVRDLVFGQTGSTAINNTSLLTMKWNGSTGIGISGNGAIDAAARLHVKGSGNDNTTTSLLVQNSDGTDLLKVTDDSDITLSKLVTVRNSSAGLFSRMYADGYGAGGPLMWVNGSMNLGSAPSTAAKLQIKGSGATSATTALLVQNSAGTDLLKVDDDGDVTLGTLNSNGGSILFNSSSGSLTYGEISVNSGSGEMKIGATRNSFFPTFYSSGSEAMRINTSKFVGIGETTPTARLHVKGSGNDATTTALLVQNSDAEELLKATDDGAVAISANGGNTTIGSSSGSGFIVNSGRANNIRANTSGVAINGYTVGNTALKIYGQGATSATTALLVENSAGTTKFKVDDSAVSTGVSISNTINGYSSLNWYSNNVGFGLVAGGGLAAKVSNSGAFVVATGGTISHDASAVLQADSTTKGFLPPRMTTTERDAITSPASGLIVYNTTTNKAQCYNGTTWNDLF